MTILERLERIVSFLNRQKEWWERLQAREAVDLTDEQVKGCMGGHAMWDDPPPEWTERDLLLWSRGYLHAESVHLGNAASMVSLAIDVDGGLNGVLEELRTGPQQ